MYNESVKQFVALLGLGGINQEGVKVAFRNKLGVIVKYHPAAKPLQQVLGRTADNRQLEASYNQLGAALCPRKDIYTFAGLKLLSVALGSRLGFLQLDEGKNKSDEAKSVLNTWSKGRALLGFWSVLVESRMNTGA